MQARKFFVGGNFKSNGTVADIKKILGGLNSAKLDPNTGMSPAAKGMIRGGVSPIRY